MGKIPHFYLDYHPIALNLKFHGTYRFIGLSHILCGGKEMLAIYLALA
jgi:hypothetical protein